MAARMPLRWKVTLAVGIPGVLLWVLWSAVVGWVALDPVQGIGPGARYWVIESLRATSEGRTRPSVPAGTVGRDLARRFPGPVFVTLYLRGRVIFRFVSKPRQPLSRVVADACRSLGADASVRSLSTEDRRASRFKVDLTLAQGPILTKPRLLLALSVVPGLDGIGLRTASGRVAYMAPDELLRRNLVTGYRPFKFVKEFKAGLHVGAVAGILARRAQVERSGKDALPPGRLFRFRTQGFVEAPWVETGKGSILIASGREQEGADAGSGASDVAIGQGGGAGGVRDDTASRNEEGRRGLRPGGRKGPMVVVRGNTPPPRFNRRSVLAACVRGGRYMLRMLAKKPVVLDTHLIREPNGRLRPYTEQELLPGERLVRRPSRLLRGQFGYIYYPLTNDYTTGGYSLPRHAGAAYGLAVLAGLLRPFPSVPRWQVEAFRKGAALSIEYLAERVRKGRCRGPDFTCVSFGSVTDLGSTALPVVAIMEYVRMTGDRRFLDLGRRMSNFLLFMQRGDGEFCHIYDVAHNRKDCKTTLLYYSGEATLALALAYKVFKDPRYLKAAEAGLDYQTGQYLAPLTMKFLYGEDHWTAIAAHEVWPFLKKKRYAQFAYGFADFQQRQQFVQGEAFDDYVGGYGITPFFPPHLTPAGSRTEAAVAAYRLSVARGERRRDILHQIRRAFSYIVRHQVRPENSYMFVDPAMADGAVRKSPVKFDVRIDYVQHTVVAMLRGLDLVPK
ncbi:MAG: hypothetical protein J7M25_01355 [Deltaproteobacteria bacterium]|nr:hypothetical protein [Deltaproteobacteria bacterium]